MQESALVRLHDMCTCKKACRKFLNRRPEIRVHESTKFETRFVQLPGCLAAKHTNVRTSCTSQTRFFHQTFNL